MISKSNGIISGVTWEEIQTEHWFLPQQIVQYSSLGWCRTCSFNVDSVHHSQTIAWSPETVFSEKTRKTNNSGRGL